MLLALNVSSLAQLNTIQRHRAILVSQLRTNQMALALVTFPKSRTLSVNGKSIGMLVLNSELRYGVLFAWRLDPLDFGHIYQIWLIQPDGKQISGGFFRSDLDQPFVSALISSPQLLSVFAGLDVTVEPNGGSPAPTGQRVSKASLKVAP